LVGTKTDLEAQRAVPKEEGQSLAEAHGIPFFEVSAKSQKDVSAPFEYISKKVYDRLQKTGVLRQRNSYEPATIADAPEPTTSCC
jgi:GTPase SAR1 family protein